MHVEHRSKLQNAFQLLVESFSSSLQELRAVCLLRLEESALAVFGKDMEALQTNVRALEEKLKEIKEVVAREKRAIRRVEAVIEDCKMQTLHLNYISDHLPPQLPQQPLADVAINTQLPENASKDLAGDSALQQTRELVAAPNNNPAERRKRQLHAPRRYVAEQEYGILSTYMTQRLPLSKVNMAVEDAAELAESNMKMLAHAKTGGKMLTHDWKRAQSLLLNVANKDVVKGRYWFTDADLKKRSILKPDKTGKAIMTVLRHLGRIHEARLSVNDKLESIYILTPE